MKSQRVLEFTVVLVLLAVLIPWLRKSEESSPEPHLSSDESLADSQVAPPPDRLVVDGVWLGMTKQELLTNLGEASRVTPSNADYEQWDYFGRKRLTLMLDAADKVVTVDGSSLTRDGKEVVSVGMPLKEVEQVLGKSRESLDTLADFVNPGFSTDGQLIHLEHRQKKVSGRVTMTVDYSVVRPPQEKPVSQPQPRQDRAFLREPVVLRQPIRNP